MGTGFNPVPICVLMELAMKKALILSSIVFSLVVVGCGSSKDDEPYSAKPLTKTGKVSTSNGTGEASQATPVKTD
jgi:hypothetical protein